MPKVTLDVPEQVLVMLKALEARLKEVEADKSGAAKAVTEAEVDAVTSKLGLEYKRRSLQALDIDARGSSSTENRMRGLGGTKRRTSRKKGR